MLGYCIPIILHTGRHLQHNKHTCMIYINKEEVIVTELAVGIRESMRLASYRKPLGLEFTF